MLKIFGLMTVKAHKAEMDALCERKRASYDSMFWEIRGLREALATNKETLEDVRLALFREMGKTAWFKNNAAIRCPKTKRILSAAKGAEAAAEAWSKL